jgi:hypothetical protein
MKPGKTITFVTKSFIVLSALSFLSVSLMAFNNPQSVMDLVNVRLQNNDAYSSIRGVYGGVGLALFISLIYCLKNNRKQGLGLLCLLWGFYSVSRIFTIYKEGALGSFGYQWLLIESLFFLISLILFQINKRSTGFANQ